jgi:amidase
MAELHDLSALDQAAAIRVGDISAVELTKHYLARSESLGRAVGAFILLTPELALVQAQAADDAVRRGDPNLGPLHGVVVPIKDLNNVSGVPTTYGAGLPAATAAADDYVVARMREAFLVFTGKTNTPEFGLPCYTENSIAEAARTPWDLTRSAGGSSGGSAAAVAAGLASVGQGNDGGGSIRIPASVCGLVGLKPSRHRISNGPWGDSVGELSVEGPLGRTVADVAALLDVMAVPFVDDPVILERSEGGFLAAARRTPHRLRIGRYRQPVIANVEIAADCLAGYEETSSLLAELGHDIVEAPPPFDHDVVPLFETLWAALALSIPVPDEAEVQLAPLTRWLRDRGRRQTAGEVTYAVASIRYLTRSALRVSAQFDVVLTPTLAAPPALVGQLRNDQDPAADFEAQKAFTPFTSPYNVTGQPAITLPLYWTDMGLPIGSQLVGRPGQEDVLLSLAAQLEAARPWSDRRPACW